MMNKIREIIRRKQPAVAALSLGYLVIVGFLKWSTRPDIGAVMFMSGGVLGMFFPDIMEVFLPLSNPSPFRNIVFVAGLAIVSLFVVTSSGSMLASGLVLSLFVTILLRQYEDRKTQGNLGQWYQMIAGPVAPAAQQWIAIGSAVFFLIVTVLFIR
jgi:hypothetical protein